MAYETQLYLTDAMAEARAEVNSQPRPDLAPTPDPSRDVHPASSRSTVTTDPMSKWNVDALVALKGKLKENVRMIALANYLETPAGGFMNRAEAQSVRAKTEDAQQIEQVIDILQGKGDKEFATFCQMLRKSNYPVWARQLELKAEMFKTSDADPSPNPAPLPQNLQRVPSQQSANTTTHPPSPTLNNMCWPELPALQDEFSTLVSKLSETLQTLEQHKFDSLLGYLNERLRPMVDGYLPTQGAPSLPNSPTPSELIQHLQNYNYWSFLNPDLLESIIKRVSGVGSPLASLMAEYKKSFRTKVTNTLKECKRNNVKPEPPPHYTTLHHHSSRDQQQGISDHRSFHLHQILQLKDFLVQKFGMSDALFKEWRTEMTARYAAGPIFTDEDVHRLLDEERGVGEQGGWSLASQSDNVEVWRKAEEGVPVHLLKGIINFPGIPHTAVVDMILDVEHRREWDRVFNEIAILEDTNDYKIMYWCIRSPLVSNRSVIQYVKDFEDKKNNAHLILCKNYPGDHPNAPDMSGTVRAETIFAGVIIRPDADHPDSTRLSMLFQTDMKGWIPNFLVNLFSARAPKQWQEQVTEYYHNGYHQRKK